MSRMSRRLACLALVGVACFARAQDSGRPVTLVVPFAAGGVTDVAARIVAPELARQLGTSVVVENRVGAGGRIGAEAVMRGPKDGSIIGVLNSGLGINLPLMSDFKVEPGRDYTPLSKWFETYTVLVAHPSMPFDDIKGLIDHARGNPGKLNWGSAGVGTSGHLALELLKSLAEVDIVHVAYKGDANVTTDLLANTVQLAVSSAPIKPNVEARKLKAIATTGPTRWSVFANVPTFEEGGVRGFNVTAWQGFIAPPGLPPAIADRFSRAIRTTLQVPAVRQQLEALGLKVEGTTGDEFSQYIRKDLAQWAPIVQRAKIRIE